MQKSILIIEDDRDIAEIEKDYLELDGFQVTIIDNGTDGLEEALKGKHDLILLDVMLPGLDGFEICRRVRNQIDIPIMMVTAKRTDIDKIRGLGFGADAYIDKPFSPSVLVAKIKAQLAQYERLKGLDGSKRSLITLGKISLDADAYCVYVDGVKKNLPKKEFQLLQFLMTNADIVFSREVLYDRIWKMDSVGNTATIPVHINRLREAIEEDPENPRYLLTVWGVGYKFQP